MRVGIYFTANQSNGGIFQYSLAILKAISASGHDVIIFNMSSDLSLPESTNVRIVDMRKSSSTERPKSLNHWFKKVVFLICNTLSFIGIHRPSISLRVHKERGRASVIDSENLDVVFFPNDADLSIICDTPVIASIHDLQHRINPQFPEVSEHGQYQWREYFFRKLTKKAKLLIAESDVGKAYITEFYNVPDEKIVVLPYLPPEYLEHQDETTRARMRRDYNLPPKFFFYPAQMWPHKNHLRIIEAMHLLSLQGLTVHLVLSGAKKDKWKIYETVVDRAQEYGIAKNVIYLGYVDEVTMAALYEEALGLIMPTFFGPSNIPILEAWKLGCPVIYSDIRGCREQAGDAALLCDPLSEQSIAIAMKALWSDVEICAKLKERGKERLSKWTKADFYSRMTSLLNDLA